MGLEVGGNRAVGSGERSKTTVSPRTSLPTRKMGEGILPPGLQRHACIRDLPPVGSRERCLQTSYLVQSRLGASARVEIPATRSFTGERIATIGDLIAEVIHDWDYPSQEEFVGVLSLDEKFNAWLEGRSEKGGRSEGFVKDFFKFLFEFLKNQQDQGVCFYREASPVVYRGMRVSLQTLLKAAESGDFSLLRSRFAFSEMGLMSSFEEGLEMASRYVDEQSEIQEVGRERFLWRLVDAYNAGVLLGGGLFVSATNYFETARAFALLDAESIGLDAEAISFLYHEINPEKEADVPVIIELSRPVFKTPVTPYSMLGVFLRMTGKIKHDTAEILFFGGISVFEVIKIRVLSVPAGCGQEASALEERIAQKLEEARAGRMVEAAPDQEKDLELLLIDFECGSPIEREAAARKLCAYWRENPDNPNKERIIQHIKDNVAEMSSREVAPLNGAGLWHVVVFGELAIDALLEVLPYIEPPFISGGRRPESYNPTFIEAALFVLDKILRQNDDLPKETLVKVKDAIEEQLRRMENCYDGPSCKEIYRDAYLYLLRYVEFRLAKMEQSALKAD